MNIKNILTNGLPEELANLKLGQVVIFSSPGEGMSEPNIRISQFISSVVKQLKKSGIHVDSPAVYVVPTENTNLWDCISCKVITNKKNVIELADKGSLTEMLYDYWGLDFNSLPKPVIINRYVSYQFFIADYHPYKICIEPIAIDTSSPRTRGADYDYDNVYDFDIDYDPTSFSISLISVPTQREVEKNLKNGFYASSQELARDFRNIFSNLFSSSLTKLDSDKYNKIFILSEIFENIFEKHEKNSQIKMAQKLSDELARLKKEINKLTRHRKNKTGDVSQVSNLEEKNEKSNDNIREDIISKINRLNSEQKKGILDIISDNLVNKNCDHNIIELDINKLPLNQLKKLDIYINKCINDNININSNIKRQNVEKESDLIQNDELSISSSCLSDSEDSESFELE